MNISEVENKDVERVRAICMDSFLMSVADTLSESGVSSFSKVAASDAFSRRMKEDNLILIAEKTIILMV